MRWRPMRFWVKRRRRRPKWPSNLRLRPDLIYFGLVFRCPKGMFLLENAVSLRLRSVKQAQEEPEEVRP